MEYRLTPEERITIETYDDMAQTWSANHSTTRFWGLEMDRFQSYLPQGRVLEIGCGGGRDAQELIALGYRYVGIDISAGFLTQARLNNPLALFLRMSAYDLAFKENSFAGFWASAVLLHLPKNRVRQALEELHRVTRPKGVGFISVKEGQGEGLIDQRFFAFYSQEEFASLLKTNGFGILKQDIKKMSEKTTWLTFLVEALK